MEINAGENNKSQSNINKRQREIAQIINYRGSVRVAELSEQFRVSEETIRRDFEKLENMNVLKKIHGGAVKVEEANEVPQLQRQAKHKKEKESIARKASTFVEDGDIIAIDASSTGLYMAKLLKGRSITVLTNSIGVTMELASEEQMRVILIGGYLSRGSMSLVGNFSEKVIEDYHVDKYFFSCYGVDVRRGVSEMHEDQALVKKQLLNISEQRFLLSDWSKFGQKSLFRLCSLADVDYLITDNKVSMDKIRTYKNHGVEVLVGESF